MLNGFPSPCRGAGCEALEELPEKTEILESRKRRRSKGGETAHQPGEELESRYLQHKSIGQFSFQS